jgi:hypothetical protein
MNATAVEMKTAEQGTATPKGLLCPHCGKITPITVLRRDRKDENGNTVYGLRRWEKNEFEPRSGDVFQERLYCVKYEKANNGKGRAKRYYRTPNERDLQNEETVRHIVAENIDKWQEQGLMPSMEIEIGAETERLYKERGWSRWNHLFNARQLIGKVLLLNEISEGADTEKNKVASILGLNYCCNWNSILCKWDTDDSHPNSSTFINLALNPLFSYACRSYKYYIAPFLITINPYNALAQANCRIRDARNIDTNCNIWFTDPPYADAVNYHELSEFFLAWDKRLLKETFPEWYTDSKRILAVRGGDNFARSMIEIYTNLALHMPDDGIQIVMFTHSDPAVWAQLALIMWKSGLKVTAAWNIATETDASGLKEGNYVKGTVLLVLRGKTGLDTAFLDEINADIRAEVKNQIEHMQALDDKEDPNFSDPDYVLAAYAASLKVLTSYRTIDEIDLDRELDLAIQDPAKSKVVEIIGRARKMAYDSIIPRDFDAVLWKELSPSERFYIKGLEGEKNGNYKISTYQEYARGFALTSYGQLMANERANTCRLKTPPEFAMRKVTDAPGFEDSTLRLILAAIHIAIKEDDSPEKGLWHIKNNLPDYWEGRRDMIKQLLAFLKDTNGISNMPHWQTSAEMAEHIYILVDNDHV